MKLSFLEYLFERFSAGLAILGGLGLVFAVLVTCLSITLKLLGYGAILGEEELVAYGVGFALFASLPWVTIMRGHIKVDILTTYFNPHFNRFLNLLSDIALAILAYLILTRQWFLMVKKTRGGKAGFFENLMTGDFEMAFSLVKASHQSQVLGMPLWPTYIIAEFFVLCFFMTACFCVIRSTYTMFKP